MEVSSFCFKRFHENNSTILACDILPYPDAEIFLCIYAFRHENFTKWTLTFCTATNDLYAEY